MRSRLRHFHLKAFILMTVRLIGILILCPLLSPIAALSQYQTNGVASKEDCDRFQLTPNSHYIKGTVWRTEKVDLTEPFDLRFNFYFGKKDGSGADGIVFILQPHTDTALGINGGGLGYENIDTSLAVEFDTWLNAWGDPQEDHIAILQNGSVDHNSPDNLAGPVDAIPGAGNIEDSSYYDARLTWDPGNQELKAHFDGLLRISYTGNLVDSIFHGDSLVYWGLGSATAMAKNEHLVGTELIPEFEVEDSVVCEQDTVSFFDSSYATAGDIVDYEWHFGDGGSSSDTNPEHVFNAPGTYDVELIVKAPDSCMDSVTHSITVVDTPTTLLSGSDTICSGDSLQIGPPQTACAIPGYEYSWSPSTSLSDDSVPAPVASPSTSTEYIVEVTDQLGEVMKDSILVVVDTSCCALHADISGDSLLCNEDTAHFQNNSLVNGDPPTYEWEFGPNATPSTFLGDTSPEVVFHAPGTHQVRMKMNNSCGSDSTTATIDVLPLPSVELGKDTSACKGDSVRINDEDFAQYKYEWSPSTGLSDTGVGDPKASVDSSISYHVEVTDTQTTCAQTDTILVQSSEVQIAPSRDTTICYGEKSTLSASASGGTPSYSYYWDHGLDTGRTHTVSPKSTTFYSVYAIDSNGCSSDTASVQVKVSPTPDVRIAGDGMSGCRPVEATLVSATTDSLIEGSYTWELGDGNTIEGGDSVQHTYQEARCYDVTLSMRTSKGCIDSTTKTDHICVHKGPDAAMSIEPKEGSIHDPEFTFRNRSSGAEDYLWDFAGLDSSKQVHPTYEFPNDPENSYEICLYAEDPEGCMDSTCKEVGIAEEFVLYVPNAFTPNGDGINDRFKPVFHGAEPSDYHFFIYDRWGELIFETRDPQEGWDGSVKGEKDASKPDVYVWKLNLRSEESGKVIERTGHVTLIE